MELRNLINGEWITTKEKIMVFNPYSLKKMGSVPSCSKKEAEIAVNSARKGFEKIRTFSSENISEILKNTASLLRENKTSFIKTIVEENGKPWVWAEGEVKASIKRAEIASNEAISIKKNHELNSSDKKCTIVNKPVGVVLAISPFNYPLYTGVSKICASIAANNSVIIKPASDCPISMIRFVELMEKAGVEKNFINLITGKGSVIGDYLISHKNVNMVSFTGSSKVGMRIPSVAGMKKVLLELGGKCAAIIDDDYDFDNTVSEVVKGCFKMSGQRCDAISRILIPKKMADEFIAGCVKEIKKWKIGNPMDKNTMIGPLINQKALEKVDGLVQDAVKKGAKIIIGGKKKELVYHPTILDKVNTNMKIALEETFGPVMPVLRVNDFKEAVRLANQSNYALDSCIFSKDHKKAFNAAKLLNDGSIHINRAPTHGHGEFPFGGNKYSGLGREGVNQTIYEMSNKQSIVIKK